MRFVTEIRNWLARGGAVTLAVEFLGADGVRLGGPAWQHRVDQMVVTDRAIAYESCAGIRLHGHPITRTVRDGPAWILVTGQGTRLAVAPSPGMRAPAGVVRPDRLRRSRTAELRRLVRSISLERHPQPGPARPATFWAKYHASWDQGCLRTVGALVRGPGEQLEYTGVTDSSRGFGKQMVWAALGRGISHDDLFEAMEGNGVTASWSEAFSIVAASIETASARLMSRVRLRGLAAKYLRELWLSMDEELADEACEEAETVAAGAGFGLVARRYLDRIAHEHARLHRQGTRLCHRTTQMTRPTGEGGGGLDRV